MDCDFCTNPGFKLKVYNIGGEQHIWKPSDSSRIYHLGSDINSYDPLQSLCSDKYRLSSSGVTFHTQTEFIFWPFSLLAGLPGPLMILVWSRVLGLGALPDANPFSLL